MGQKWPSVSLCSMFLLADVATTQTMLISTHWCPLAAQLISSHISFISIQLQTILVIFFQMEKSELDPESPNFFKSQTLLFKLVSSQAGQLGIEDTNAAPPGGTFLRNITEDRRRKKTSAWRELNSRPVCYKAYGLPLCHNHCPRISELEASVSTSRPTPTASKSLEVYSRDQLWLWKILVGGSGREKCWKAISCDANIFF